MVEVGMEDGACGNVWFCENWIKKITDTNFINWQFKIKTYNIQHSKGEGQVI